MAKHLFGVFVIMKKKILLPIILVLLVGLSIFSIGSLRKKPLSNSEITPESAHSSPEALGITSDEAASINNSNSHTLTFVRKSNAQYMQTLHTHNTM